MMSDCKECISDDAENKCTTEVNAKYMNSLEEPYTYQTQVAGKAIRDQMIEAMNLWLGVDGPVLKKIKDMVKILHESSLLIDDIQDSSKMRRGQPAAYLIYGISQVINIANLKYFEAGKIAQELDVITPYIKDGDVRKATSIFHESMIALHVGQGLDIHWRDSNICPSVDEYVDMVIKKTGGLMMLSYDLMYLFRTKDTLDYKTGYNFLVLFSKFFQIRDDFCNLWDVRYTANKSYCEDLTEGKFSWVIINGILREKDRGTNRIMSILKQHTTSDDLKKYCCQVLESLGVKKDTLSYLTRLEEDLNSQIKDLGGNEEYSGIVKALSPLRIETDPDC